MIDRKALLADLRGEVTPPQEHQPRHPSSDPRTRHTPTEPDPGHITAVLDAAASGPLSNEQIRALTGLDTAGARAFAQHLITRGELVTTGQKRGTRYHLPL